MFGDDNDIGVVVDPSTLGAVLDQAGGRMRASADRSGSTSTLSIRDRAMRVLDSTPGLMDPTMDLTHRTTRWHRWLWQHGSHANESWVTDGNRPGWEQASREVYADLLEGSGRLDPLDPDEVPEFAKWASDVHDLLDDSADYRKLRSLCRDDPEWSGLGAGSVMRAILDNTPDPGCKHDPAAVRETADTIREMGDTELADELGAIADEQQQAIQSDRDGIAAEASRVRGSVGDAAAEVMRAIAKAEAAREALGGNLPGDGADAPGSAAATETTLALAKAVAELPDLAAIIKIAGRLQSSATAIRKEQIRPHVGPVVDVTQGGLEEVARLLSSELVRMDDGLLEDSLLRDLTERQAMVYEMEGDNDVNERGPVLLMLDISTSMNSGDPSRNTWSKGVLIAVAGTCRREGRSLAVAHYNGGMARFRVWNTPPGIAEVLDELSVATSGGTALSVALPAALSGLPSTERWEAADVVIVTDGQDTLDPSVLTGAQAAGRSLFATFIDCGAPGWGSLLDGYCELSDEAIAREQDGEAADLMMNTAMGR